MSNKVVHALYDDDDVLLSAVKAIRSDKHHIEEVYTPFPVHGLDKALGLEDTRIAIMAFIYGCIGLCVAVAMMNFIMIEDWPQDIGGCVQRPHKAMSHPDSRRCSTVPRAHGQPEQV